MKTVATLALLTLAGALPAQGIFPDLLYYKFDEGSGSMTANLAVPGAGALNASLVGQQMAPGVGQFNGGLTGAAGSGSVNYVDTGWVTNLPGDFTLSYWLDVSAITTAAPFMYTLGDNTAASFRSFTNGAAGTNGVILRQTGMADVIIPGGASPSGPQAVAWVYDSTVPEIRAYLNGVLVATVAQSPLVIAGSQNFKVGSYSTSTSILVGAVMDEFRLYSWALSSAEIASSWNVDLLNNANPFSLTVTGTPAGAATIDLMGVPSSTTEGWTFVSADTGAAQGMGPVFGITPDALSLLLFNTFAFPAVGSPFHWLPGFPGFHPDVPYTFADGTTSGLSGLGFDWVTVTLDVSAQVVGISNVERIVWP